MKQLWMRAGINLSLTDEEAGAILAPGASADAIEQTVKKIILEGRFCFSGESYIPQPCVEQYNDAYGTAYKADDIDFDIDISNMPIAKKHNAFHEEDVCPRCGGDLMLREKEDDGNAGFCAPWTCEDCGATGMAGYTPIFDGHYGIIERSGDEDDEYADCDGECVGCDRACADRINN